VCFINNIFSKYLDKFILVFLDDTLTFSKFEDEYDDHLWMALQVLGEYKLYAKLNKCKLYEKNIHFLVQIISKRLCMGLQKIEAIVNWPTTNNVIDMRSFMDIVTYYQIYIDGFFKIAQSINSSQNNGRSLSSPVNVWKVVTNWKISSLVHLFWRLYITRKTLFCIDACSEGLGEVLMQDNHMVCCES